MAKVSALNPFQIEAVRYADGPLLIIAGAGTGKTTVITERIKYLIFKKNISPSQILALTFTEKASRVMEERVDLEMPYGYTQMWISTFHSFCDRILRQEAVHIGLNPSYKLMTQSESILFLRKNIFKFKLSYFRPLGNPNKFLEGMLQHFSRLGDEDVSPEEYLRYSQKFKVRSSKFKAPTDEIKKINELAIAYKTYQDLKNKEGVMDFSDLITNTLKLFRTRKNILSSYQKQFKYILVDEFQDTNFAQNQLAILLAGSEKNITVVGDDDQAIYRWRGAAISNMIQFKKHYPNAHIITLTQNYRSKQEILDCAHRVIQNNNPDRLEAKENINKKLISQRKQEKKFESTVQFLYKSRVEDEAETVVKKIKDLVHKNYEYKDIAILVRANDHAIPFTKTFTRYNIPYQFLGPGRLFRQEEIKDLIAYLKVLYNFEDSLSLYRVLGLPIFNIEARDVAAILNFAKRKGLTLFEALEKIEDTSLNPITQEKIKKIVEMIKRHLKRVPIDSAGQVLYYFLEDSGLLKKFLSVESNIESKNYQNIAKFFDRLKTFEVEHEDSRIFPVVDWIELSMQMGESPLASDMDWNEVNAVNILTIHSSKGLEFPVVFLVNLVSQRFPTRERREQIPIPAELIKEILPTGDYHLQEERRLFYVGVTRAKDLLFLTAANYYGEGKRDRKISPFVYEALGGEELKKFIEKYKFESIIIQPSLLEWNGVSLSGTSSLANEARQAWTKLSSESSSITYISYSQIQTFTTCPLHYKLQYLLKIPYRPTPAMSFGSSVHATLKESYQRLMSGQKLKTQDIIAILEKYWIDEGYENKSHQKEAKERAIYIISQYLKNNSFMNRTLGIEIPFNFFINGKLKIAGRIDRIDKTYANKIEIIDYKTGINIPTEKELTENFQLSLYALAATQVKSNIFNKKPDDIILSLHYLEEEKTFSTTRGLSELEEAKNKILNIVSEIEKSDFKCSGTILCQNCEYKMICSTSA